MNLRRLLATGAALAIYACGSGAERQATDGAPATSGATQEPGSSESASVRTAAVPAACDLIPRAEVERLAGALQGEPKREGNGCWYYVAMDTTSAEWKQVRGNAERARAGGMDERTIELYHPTRAGLYVEVDVRGSAEEQETSPSDRSAGTQPTAPPAGWDAVRIPPRATTFRGRAGHMTVALRLQALRLHADTLLAIASRVRDRIPDGPIAHPAADRSGPRAGRDPCSVLAADEAEAVLGKLLVPPFRTRERTPLADPSGRSCGYFTAGHRVLVVTPEWEYGRAALDAERMVGGMVRQVADLPGIEGDTLEGPWDEAAVGLSGELLLLKGPRALGMLYHMSSTDAAGAIRLAGPALQRLAAAPESERPRAATDGCLPEATVAQAVEAPVRLFVNAVASGGMCDYALQADPTVHVELTVQPERAADQIFAGLKQRVKYARGQAAEAERLGVGDEGWAYGSGSHSEAAARRGGKVYHARMRYAMNTSIPDRKDAMVQLLTRMME